MDKRQVKFSANIFLKVLCMVLVAVLCIGSAAGCRKVNPSTDLSSSGSTGVVGSIDTDVTSSDESTPTDATESTDSTPSGDSSSSTTAPSGDGGTQTPPTVAPTDEDVDTGIVTDLKGRTIKIFSYGYTKEWATNTAVGRLQEQTFDKVEKELNCKIEILSGPADTDFDPIFTSILAGDPIVDIVNTAGPHTLAKPITTNLYMDLDQFEVFNWKESKWDNDTMEIAEFGGKQYVAFIDLIGDSAALMNNAMFFNKRLVKEAGYNPDDIYKWQENGTWTWAKFKEVASKISKLDPGNIYGTGGNGAVLYENLVVSNGTDYFLRSGDSVVFNGGNSAAMEAMKFYIELHQEGIMSDDDTSANSTQFIAGKIGFLPDVLERLQYSNTYGKMKDDYGVVMIPKGPQAKDYVSMFNWYGGYAIPTGTKDPAAVASVLNAICDSPYGSTAAANKAAIVAQETYVRDEQSLAVFDMVKTRTFTSAQWLGEPVRTQWLALLPDLKAGKLTPANAVSEHKDEYADMLKNTWAFKF